MSATKTRDYTEYTFKGAKYGKGRLALAVVKHYLKANPQSTVKEVKTLFNTTFYSAFNIIERKRKANPKRFFVNDDDSIHVIGGNIVVANQWTVHNIVPFIGFARKTLGLTIK